VGLCHWHIQWFPLAKEGKLAAFHHTGYWKCMDTLRDKVALEAEWQGGAAPWKLWGTS
jgi:glucose-1-phosphate cytidylyltransferase